MIHITVNGKKIEADETRTILENIRDHKLASIPTLCSSAHTEHFTSCFLCVVEAEGSPRLIPSCSTKPTEGMKILTDSPKVHASRKMNLNLLLSNHYADCHPPCRLACPANVDIQGYIALAARGLYKEGQKLMRETNALPMVCGRVCARPCESACRRNHVDEPVDIKNIKRFMADLDLESDEQYTPEPVPDLGIKAAVVGAGPAGLSCAYFLRLKGYQVSLFESLPEPGGMLRYGIPEFRLPKADLKKEINAILNLGIELNCGQSLGKNFTLKDLTKRGFKSIFIGTGAQKGVRTHTPGEDHPSILQGVDFLREVNLGKRTECTGKVLVIGGGSTAMDSARVALRLGAGQVDLSYRRTEKEMPADQEEITEAHDEGISFKVLTSPLKYTGHNNGQVTVTLGKMELGPPDDSGRQRPMPVKGGETKDSYNLVIEAIGQSVESDPLSELHVNPKNCVLINETNFQTNIKNVFAGGDAVTGPDIIITAIAHGRKAAHSMDQYMRGLSPEPENRLGFYIRKEDFQGPELSDFSEKEKIPRQKIEKLPKEKRNQNFKEVDLGFTPENLQKEAERCMECGCQDLHECSLRKLSGEYGVQTDLFPKKTFKRSDYDLGSPFLRIEPEKCINCGACARVCLEYQKQNVIAFMRRGFDTAVLPFNQNRLSDTNCIVCGACAAVCPTGAITEKTPLGKPGPFQTEKTATTCILCSDACPVTVETRDGNFIRITSSDELLCFRGRFGYKDLISGVLTPSKSELDKIHQLVRDLSPERDLITLSPRLTLEEIELIIQLASEKQIDLFSFTLWPDLEKFRLIREAGLLKTGNDQFQNIEHLYYFGHYTDEHNSVAVRELINSARNTYCGPVFPHMYFSRTVINDELELLDHLAANPSKNKAVAFNLQKTGLPVIQKAVQILKKAGNPLILLNNQINYSHLAAKLKDQDVIEKKLQKGSYRTILSINEIIQQNFPLPEHPVSICEPGTGGKTGILKPFYARNGTIQNREGQIMNVRTKMKSRGLELVNILNFYGEKNEKK